MTRPPSLESAVVKIDAISASGAGVAHLHQRSLLVHNSLPGETVRIEIDRKAGTTVLTNVVEPSAQRVEPRCTHYGTCGGCSLQHANAELQREVRMNLVRRAMPESMRDRTLGYTACEQRWEHRTRLRLHWVVVRNQTIVGLHARATNEVVPIGECLVIHPALRSGLAVLTALCGTVASRGEVDLALGSNGQPVANLRPSTECSAAAYEVPARMVAAGFCGIALWPLHVTAPTIAGDPSPRSQTVDGRSLRVAPGGFAQANDSMNAQLIGWVARHFARDDLLLELFCGAGNFTVALASQFRKITAIESDPAACEALRSNLIEHHITNAHVVNDNAQDHVRRSLKKGGSLLLDPPRTGAREVCELLVKHPPHEMIYVSCDPPTLGRDLAILAPVMGVVEMHAFEMFPHTTHVEVAVLLHRVTKLSG